MKILAIGNATAEQAFDEVMKSGNSNVAEMQRTLRSFLKENDMELVLHDKNILPTAK